MISTFTSPSYVNRVQESWQPGYGVTQSGGAGSPTLYFDFLTGVLNPAITFTRASTATYFNSAGVLTSAAINEARFDYNPSTLAARGLLIEESRANLLTYSAQFDNAAWTKQSTVSVSANTTIAPDGTTSGDTVTADSGLAIYQSASATIGVTYCQSVFIKAGTATAILFRDDTGAGRNITINPSTGAITATGGTLVGYGSQAISGGWYRYWFSYVADTTLVRGLMRPDSAGAAQTYIVWGAQTEAGAFPTSYIPTTTTALTRAADVASVNTLTPWYNATEGTLYAEFVLEGLKSVASQVFVQMDDGTTNNRLLMGSGSLNTMQMLTASGGTQDGTVTTPSTTYSAGATYKQGFAVQVNNLQGAVNGSAGSVDTTATMPVGLSNMKLGASTLATSNLWLRRITYYPRRLSNAELVSITS
jgi:hypothetical protein